MSALLKWFESLMSPQLPRPAEEIAWTEYLKSLEADDLGNVQEIARRVQQLANKHKFPLAIMAVGSSLNRTAQCQKDAPYKDVDLILLPHEYPNNDGIEELLSEFAQAQPETAIDLRPENSKEHIWHDHFCYNVCHFWNLEFAQGKKIQLFVYTAEKFNWPRPNLREKLKMEAEETPNPKPFAYQIFSPQPRS